jgi:hypothetical protein
MEGEMVPVTGRELRVPEDHHRPPIIITAAGKAAAFAYAEFFGAEIESPHTYRAYRRAVDRFLTWCNERIWCKPGVAVIVSRHEPTRQAFHCTVPRVPL